MDERGRALSGNGVLVRIEIASTLLARVRGLLGRGDLSCSLLLAPCNDIHTFGMKYPIDVAFLDNAGVVVRADRGVGPRRRVVCRRAVATLERVSVDKPWFQVGDRIGLVAEMRAGTKGEGGLE